MMRKKSARARRPIHLDALPEELQWWSVNGFVGVIEGVKRRGQQWSRAKAEKRVKYLITQMHESTKYDPSWFGVGNPLWNPQTSQDYEQLRYASQVPKVL